MADQIELELDFHDPYKGTRLFVKRGRAFFGIWNPPPIQIDGDEEEIIVQQGMEGQLDLFSDAVYGTRLFWRAIGNANKIGLPLRDVKIGMRLVIPKPALVRAAYLATTSRQGGSV